MIATDVRTPVRWRRRVAMLGWVMLLGAVSTLVSLTDLHPSRKGLVFAVGAIGAWRYSWALLNVVRAVIYRRLRFPGLRLDADRTLAQAEREGRMPRLFVLVTSYRMDPQVTGQVYPALFREAAAFGAPVTIVAAVTDTAEMRLLSELHGQARAAATGGHDLQLVLMRQAGTGKRDAMAQALRAIARRAPAPDDVVVLMDGDSRLEPNTLRRCVGFFGANPDVGAVTTDNHGLTTGTEWAKQWYELRFAQRHQLMCSLSLSRRLLVLTGRFSLFRAGIATDPGFIRRVGADEIQHWRHGRLTLLTGDDKSTWYWVLRRGWRMLYVPDVRVGCFERLPSDGFVDGSTRLMMRWFGNMLRGSGRAIRLGPKRTGWFPWVTLVDQRVSMWTSLGGPIFCLMSAVARTPAYLLAYGAWVLTTRLAQTLVLGAWRRQLNPYFPPLLYYTQVYGSLIKVHMSFRLDQQRWTRQGLATGARGRFAGLYTRYLTVVAGVAFLTAVALISDLLRPPGGHSLFPQISRATAEGQP